MITQILVGDIGGGMFFEIVQQVMHGVPTRLQTGVNLAVHDDAKPGILVVHSTPTW